MWYQIFLFTWLTLYHFFFFPRVDLVLRYYDYPYNTHVTDIQAPNLDLEIVKDYLSPDVTLCNMIPLKPQKSNTQTISQFRERFASYKADGKIPKDYEDILESILGLLQYVGVDAAINMSHGKNDLIQHCNIMYDGPMGVQSVPCDYDRNIRHTFTQNWFSCYTLHFYENQFLELSAQGKLPIGVNVILYTGGDLSYDIDYPFVKEEFRNTAVGAMIGSVLFLFPISSATEIRWQTT